MAVPRVDNRSAVNFSIRSTKIILKQGDIFDETDVDVTVVPTPDYGKTDSKTYPIFEKLLAKSNERLRGEIKSLSKKIAPNEDPKICKDGRPAIMLTATPFYGNERKANEMLQNTYRTCLRIAVSNNYRTIAFPTIGCGKSGFPPKIAAENLFKALTQFESSEMQKMKEIRVIIYDKDIYEQFTNCFLDESSKKASKIKLEEIYEDDFVDDTDDHRRNDGKRKPDLRLKPDTPEFKPKNANRTRDTRIYRINNNRTELIIEQGDILKIKVDAIVNAANESMLGGGGVDGIIHDAAGNELLKACRAHKEIYPRVRLPTGRSRILLSYDMHRTTHYIINTAGPRYEKDEAEECKKHLTSCYKTSLALANLYDLETIAFTAISCGIFDYPTDEGAEVALTTVNKEAGSMRQIRFVLKDDEIYDAWVKKADELTLISLNPSRPSSSKPSRKTDDTKKESTEKSKENDQKKGSKRSIVNNPPDPKSGESDDDKRKSDEDGEDEDAKRKERSKDRKSSPSLSNDKTDETKSEKSDKKTKDKKDEKTDSKPSSPEKSSERKFSGEVGRGRGKPKN